MDSAKRIVISGSGGQGVITAAIILAEAAAIHDGLNAVQTQSYGPEARGGASRADVIISEYPIHYPKVMHPHILVCLTQKAYYKYSDIIRPGGLLLTDSKNVKQRKVTEARQMELDIHDTVMKKIGSPMTFNICMLGALIGLTRLVRPESIIKIIEGKFPNRFLAVNQKAFKAGLELVQTDW